MNNCSQSKRCNGRLCQRNVFSMYLICVFNKSCSKSSCKNTIKESRIAYLVIMRVVVPRLECFMGKLFRLAIFVSLTLRFLIRQSFFKAGTFAEKTLEKTIA